MEAKAMFTFDATQVDELSFKEGDILKVRVKDEGGWFQAELNGKTGFVPSTYIQMEPHHWYKGNISRHDAEGQLTIRCCEGCFLVRDCQTDQNQFSLSVLHGKRPQHFKILSNPNGTYYLWPDKTFSSINKLIEYHRCVSVAKEPSSKILLRDNTQTEEEEYEAVYDFEPESRDEVKFCRGDRLRILDKSDPNWWSGEVVRSGQKGFLPQNYIKKCQ